MVMRIDDGAGGIDDVFGVLRKPVFARIGIEPAYGGRRGADGHGCLLPVFRKLLVWERDTNTTRTKCARGSRPSAGLTPPRQHFDHEAPVGCAGRLAFAEPV